MIYNGVVCNWCITNIKLQFYFFFFFYPCKCVNGFLAYMTEKSTMVVKCFLTLIHFRFSTAVFLHPCPHNFLQQHLVTDHLLKFNTSLFLRLHSTPKNPFPPPLDPLEDWQTGFLSSSKVGVLLKELLSSKKRDRNLSQIPSKSANTVFEAAIFLGHK